ncbi:hypothetical protein QO006_003964, partial [Deinococcus enclensis]|nr:hypothetical protein [Deinococcus enclensis]
RTWQGLHHHAVLCLVALLFLQWLRLAQLDGFWSEPSGADQEARHFAPVSP